MVRGLGEDQNWCPKGKRAAARRAHLPPFLPGCNDKKHRLGLRGSDLFRAPPGTLRRKWLPGSQPFAPRDPGALPSGEHRSSASGSSPGTCAGLSPSSWLPLTIVIWSCQKT